MLGILGHLNNGESAENYQEGKTGVSILTSYGVHPHYVNLPIFSEFMENSGLTASKSLKFNIIQGPF